MSGHPPIKPIPANRMGTAFRGGRRVRGQGSMDWRALLAGKVCRRPSEGLRSPIDG